LKIVGQEEYFKTVNTRFTNLDLTCTVIQTVHELCKLMSRPTNPTFWVVTAIRHYKFYACTLVIKFTSKQLLFELLKG